MTAKHALRNMSGSRIICKTQYIVKLGIRPLLCCDVQDKLHVAPQDKTAALRTAKTLLPMVHVSIWRDSPDMDDDIHGACRRRQQSLQVFQNQLLRPDLVPWRCRDHTTCIISVCAMTDPGCSRPFCFDQKFGSDQRFPFKIQHRDANFQQQQKGIATRRIICSFVPRGFPFLS